MKRLIAFSVESFKPESCITVTFETNTWLSSRDIKKLEDEIYAMFNPMFSLNYEIALVYVEII